MTCAFDVDGTLIQPGVDNTRQEVIAFLKTLKAAGHKIIVWSGGGEEYAARWVRLLGLEEHVDATMAKPNPRDTWYVDVAFDDEETSYGKVSLRV